MRIALLLITILFLSCTKIVEGSSTEQSVSTGDSAKHGKYVPEQKTDYIFVTTSINDSVIQEGTPKTEH